MNKLELKDKIAGSVYGFAVGDSLGGPTEFMSPEAIVQKWHGEVTKHVGGGWLKLKPGEVTDDTQMTMCVMNQLMETDDFEDVETFKLGCAKKFVEWMYLTNPKDVGEACAAGIAYFNDNGSFIPEDNNVLGNGSLMRAMPCAILNLDEFNVAQGVVTHNNDECARVIQMYSKTLRGYILNNPPTQGLSDPQVTSGYLWDTFNSAMYWSSMDSFRKCVLGPVNNGGDSDTIAAITGSLAGARFGLDGIPGQWLAPLDIEVKKTLGKFINFAVDYLLLKDLVVK